MTSRKMVTLLLKISESDLEFLIKQGCIMKTEEKYTITWKGLLLDLAE